jgi:hypothetical protein
MALSADLLQFKSSGVYRLEYDKSQTATIPSDQIRMVVGFSKDGPFNTPVFVSDSGFFTNIYGDIDRTLERKGSYFHRTALAALERGPILALNLLRLNNDAASGDKVDYQTFSVSATGMNKSEKQALYSGFYNKDKFWFPQDLPFLNNIGETNTGIIQMVNLKQSPVTIFARKAQDVKSFDVLAKQWYGSGKVPAFMNDFDYISDYMLDVFIVDGDFTNYSSLSVDPIFGEFFNINGLIKSKLNNFLDSPNVTYLAKYTGSLIPDFIDLNGNNLFIQDLINFDTAKTGVLSAINKEAFDSDTIISGTENGVDLVGHNLENMLNTDSAFTQLDFISYNRGLKQDYLYAESDTSEVGVDVNTSGDISFYLTADGESSASQTPPPVTSGKLPSSLGANVSNYVIKIDKDHPDYANLIEDKLSVNVAGQGTGQRAVGSYVLVNSGASYSWAPIVSLTEASGYLYIGVSIEVVNYAVTKRNSQIWFIYEPTGSNWINTTYDYFVFESGSQTYKDWDSGVITSGDVVRLASAPSTNVYLNMTWALNNSTQTDNASGAGASTVLSAASTNYYNIPTVEIKGYSDSALTTQIVLPTYNAVPGNYVNSSAARQANKFVVISLIGKLNESLTLASVSQIGLPGNEVYLNYLAANGNISVGQYLVSSELGPNGESRLTKVIKISKETINSTQVLHVYTDQDILITAGTTVERYDTIESTVTEYKMFSLAGFTMNPNYHVPNGTEDRMNEILNDTIGGGTNLFTGLVDKDLISYRYVVDSFGLGIEPQSKYQLSYLAKSRQNAFAILNAPSMQNFRESLSPRFTDDTGTLRSRYIAEGGRLDLNPVTTYGLPSIENGSNYSAFYLPYVIIRDRGKNLAVPPAGYVSNNFIDKYTSALPWSIVAGPRRGVIGGRGLIGLETNLDKTDRDYLEPVGLNPIIFQRGIGIEIHGNKTAQQNIKSALSSIHVREVLIYIQDGIASILKNYTFEFNTPQTRLEIKSLADNFMFSVKRDNGIFDFKNIMDSSNNTPEVIDANIGVLDTYVEPVKGLEILVHRTTILKTGSIATGQFS